MLAVLGFNSIPTSVKSTLRARSCTTQFGGSNITTMLRDKNATAGLKALKGAVKGDEGRFCYVGIHARARARTHARMHAHTHTHTHICHIHGVFPRGKWSRLSRSSLGQTGCWRGGKHSWCLWLPLTTMLTSPQQVLLYSFIDSRSVSADYSADVLSAGIA